MQWYSSFYCSDIFISFCFTTVPRGFPPYMSLAVQISIVKHSVRTSLTDALIVQTTNNTIFFTSCLNFSNILLFKDFQEIFTISFIHRWFYIVHQIKLGHHELWKCSSDMDNFIIYIIVIILKICPGTGTHRRQNHFVCYDPLIILTDQGHITDLLGLLHICQHLTWIFLENSPSLVKTWSCFTDLPTKHLKWRQENWIFILVSILKTYFLISMLKLITHWVSP